MHFFCPQSHLKFFFFLYPLASCYLLPMNIGCVCTLEDLLSCLTVLHVPVELTLCCWAQAILVHAKEVRASAWRTWLGIADGTEHAGTVVVVLWWWQQQLCRFLAQAAQAFCSWMGYGLCHLQSQTGCSQSHEKVLGVWFVPSVEDVFGSW